MPGDESRLLKAAQRGDERSFLALYSRHRTPLFRFAWRLTGSADTAEDVVQECFLALLHGAFFREAQGSLRAYLFGITRHLAMKRLRISERECEETEDAEGSDAGPLEGLLSAERSEAVARAVAALPPLQREALILFEYEELSLEEIAAATASETGAVKARLHRARETLRRRLGPLIQGDPRRDSGPPQARGGRPATITGPAGTARPAQAAPEELRRSRCAAAPPAAVPRSLDAPRPAQMERSCL